MNVANDVSDSGALDENSSSAECWRRLLLTSEDVGNVAGMNIVVASGEAESRNSSRNLFLQGCLLAPGSMFRSDCFSSCTLRESGAALHTLSHHISDSSS